MQSADLRRLINRQGYAQVRIPISRQMIEQVMEAFFGFLALPDEVKGVFAHKVIRSADDRGVDHGYFRRKQSGSSGGHAGDNKEFFHYSGLGREYFVPLFAAYPAARLFDECARELFFVTVSFMRRLVGKIDQQHPGLLKLMFPSGVEPACVMRFLKYDVQEGGTCLARGHYDHGVCALAIAESHPGLRIGTDAHHMHLVTHHEGHALFFPGLRMQEFTQQQFLPSWHEVVQTESSAVAGAARWAIVLFANVHGPHLKQELGDVYKMIRRAPILDPF